MEDSKKQLEEYKNLFINMPDAGGLLDAKGNFLLVTKVFEKLMGKKEKDLIGINAFKSGFFMKDFENTAFRNMKKWIAGELVPAHDIKLNVKDKKIIIAQTKSSIVQYKGKKTFLFTLRDVTEQRRAEKLLADSENKCRDILHNSTDIAWEVNVSGNIIYISGKVKEILGYEPEELLGEKPYFIMPEDEKKRAKKILHNYLLKKENISDFRCRVLTKNGVEKIFVTNGVPIYDENNKLVGYRGVEKDITERTRNEERFKELFDNMKSGVVVYEVHEDGKNIIFKDINKASEIIEGVNKSNLIGKKLLDVFPSAKEDGIYDAIMRIWATDKSEYFSLVLNKDTEKESWRDNFVYKLSSGEIVFIYDEVTEKIKINKQIEENENKFRKIFEASPEAIVVLNKKAQVVDLNGRVTEWLGYKVDEILGRGLLDFPFFSDISKKIVVKKFTERMHNSGKDILPYELEFINKDGNIFIGRVYTKAIHGKKGEFLQDLVMISDITKEKEAEKIRIERQEQLEKMNSLMVGRELKMIELKEKINKLEEKLKAK